MGTPPSSRRNRRKEGTASRLQREAKAKRVRRRRFAWAGGGLAIVVLIAGIVWHSLTGSVGAATIDGVQCNVNEQSVYHIHAHLTIYDAGHPFTVPAGTGIDTAHNCLYWLHTHDPSGVIHVESPTQTQYTLGNFLDIWGRQITKTYFLTHGLTAGHSIRAYLSTKAYAADPRTIPLTPHQVITLEYGPPWITPDASYAFPNGE